MNESGAPAPTRTADILAAMTVASDTDIHTRRLDNGITLVFEPMPWLHSLSIAFLLPAGSVTDPNGREGSAAVLFDWLTRGAGERDSRRFNEELDGLGVRRGGSAGRESSNLSASMLARSLPDALPLLADMLRRPRLDADEFVSARELAQQELASLDDNPAQRLSELLAERYFASPHKRSVFGTRESLASLDPDSVRADYRTRYAPRGLVIAAAGGVDWERLSAEVERCFGDWQGTPPTRPEVSTEPPRRHHVSADTSQIHIGMAFPAVPPQHEDWYRQTLAMNVLSGGMGSRLFQEVREKRGLAYSVHAYTRALQGYGYVLARAGTTPDRAEETLEVLQTEIGRLREGVAGDELERSRTGILSNLVMQGESSGARASALANDIYLRGEGRSLSQLKAIVSGVTLSEVNSFLAHRDPPEPTIVTLGPGEAS